MEKDNQMKFIITGFIVLLLAIVFLGSIADQTQIIVSKTSVVDETTNLATSCYATGQVNETDADCNITVTYAPTSWKTEDSNCYLSDIVVSNATGTALTLNTDYRVYSSTGLIQMLNTTTTNSTGLGNNVLIDYSYCGDNYMATSWGRTVLNTNAGIYAIAILIIVVGMVYMLLNKKKDDDY